MSAILLVTLFAAVAFASVLTLADAAVRGRNAFRLVSGDAARMNADRRVTVTFVDSAPEQRMPALRAISAVRSTSRRAVRPTQPLRAAA